MAAAETARLIASLELQDKNFTRGLKGAEKRLGKIDKKLGAFSGAVNRNVARGIDSLVTHGIDAGQAVIQAAIDQESAIVGIRKTVNGNIDGIVEDLKKLSVETGTTFEELASIAETGGAMGIAGKDIAAFTKQVAILGATTNVSIDDAATSIGQLSTVLGFTGDEFDNFAAALVDLGNKGNSTEAQILEITKRSGAAAKTVGIATEKTLAWASAAANLGLTQEIAGTALSKLFVGTQKIIARGGEDLTDIGKVAGMTGKQFKKAFDKDASSALFSFIKGLKGLSKEQRVLAIEDLFGKGDAMTKTLLGLSEALDDPTSGLTASLKNANTAWEAGTAAQTEADKRFASSEFQFKKLNNAVNLAAATIGTELLPVLTDLAEEGVAWLMEPGTQKAIKAFAVDLGKGIRGVVTTLKGVDWGGFANALGMAAGFAGEIAKAFLSLPPWVQALAIGGFAANKLTGGLLGGAIKGALGITAGVVHLKAGTVVGGGVPGVGGKGIGRPGVGGLLMTGVAVALTGEAIALQQQISDRSTEQAQTAQDSLTAMLAQKPNQEAIKTSLAAVQTGINDIQSNPLMVLVQGEALDKLKAMETQLKANLEPTNPEKTSAHAGLRGGAPGKAPAQPVDTKPIVTGLANIKTAVAPLPAGLRAAEAKIGNVKTAISTLDANQKASAVAAIATAVVSQVQQAAAATTAALNAAAQTGAIRTGTANTTTAARNAGITTAGAMTTAANRIVGAVNALDLSVNVTTVNRTSTVNNRYGPSGGSSTTGRTPSSYHG